MIFLRRILSAAAVAACMLAGPASAQPANVSPEQLALARAVIDFTGAGGSLRGVIPQVLADARGLLLRQRPELQADLDQVILQVDEEFDARRTEILDRIAAIYAQSFSEQELQQIAAFYRSDAGRKMTEQLPGILDQSFRTMQVWSQEVSVDVMQAVRTKLEERGHKF